jgi:internalin A
MPTMGDGMSTIRGFRFHFAKTVYLGVAVFGLLGSDATAQLAGVEVQPMTEAERLEKLAARLQPIAAADGGGYFLESELSELRKEDLVDLLKIPGIRCLYDNGFGPEAWPDFGKFKGLEALESHQHLTDVELKSLAELKQLELLVFGSTVSRPEPVTSPGVSGPSFSATPLKPLVQMKQLKDLELRSNGLTDEALAHVGEVPQLLSLTLEGHFTNDGVNSLTGLKSLRQLSLDGNFDDAGLAHLAQLTNLESLELKSDQLTGAGFSHLSVLTKLRMLRLRPRGYGETSTRAGLRPPKPPVSTSLAHLKSWPALESLNLSGDLVTDDVLLTLPETDQITSLSLHGTAVTDKGLVGVSRLKNLEELDLLLTRVTDKGLPTVASLSSLRALCLGGGRFEERLITVQGLQLLRRLKHLERLDLRYVLLTEADLPALAFPTLTMLHIESLGQSEGLHRLWKRLPRLARPSSRITIKAGLFNESYYRRYNVYANRMETEW